MTNETYKLAARHLGWKWSHAHDGYIHESRRKQGIGWDSYTVAEDAEEACDMFGLETIEAVEEYLERKGIGIPGWTAPYLDDYL